MQSFDNIIDYVLIPVFFYIKSAYSEMHKSMSFSKYIHQCNHQPYQELSIFVISENSFPMTSTPRGNPFLIFLTID